VASALRMPGFREPVVCRAVPTQMRFFMRLSPHGDGQAPSPWPCIPGHEILERVGQGGMGTVYKARRAADQALVALKMIRDNSAFDADMLLARFQVEMRSAACLHHPNIVPIHGTGEVQGRPYFVMEYLEGGTLGRKLAGKPLAPREAARLVERLASAMGYAHRQGVLHRDLKPDNVLLSAAGVPKITDFGLAKLLDEDLGLTLPGTVLGTPSYMAPEQAKGNTRAVGPRADIYALGTILYEALTGRPAFKGATKQETLDLVISREPVAPSRLQSQVPRDLEVICLQCLQKDPRGRYGSADDLAEDLGGFLNNKPIRGRLTEAWAMEFTAGEGI
jgi:eukaryotic-like serine/threonine-protein kinase